MPSHAFTESVGIEVSQMKEKTKEKGVREGNILLAQILRGTKGELLVKFDVDQLQKFKFELLVMVVEQTTTEMLCRNYQHQMLSSRLQ